ncbi:MAG: hypothetical protein RIC35_11350 [Marinoscillum sp.]
MKNIFRYSYQGIATLVVVFSLIFATACEEDEMGTSEVELLSFGPAGVKHGDDIIFIGTNLDKISSVVFRPSVEISKDAFSSQSATQIKLTVPPSAEAGFVILKTNAGDSLQTKTMLNFEVPVVLNSVTAKAKPGTNITITGDKLNWIETVTFPSDLTVTKDDFVSQSLTELVVEVPMEAQSGFLIFSSGGTEPLTFATEEQLEVTLPTVSGLSPASIRHTSDLTIEGTDLDLVTEAIFADGVSILRSEFKSQSASSIVVNVPATVVKGAITLKQASPVDVATEELTIILPTVSTLTPSPAKPGVDVMVITGSDLDLIAELVLPGAGSISTFLTHNATEISFNIPEAASQGAINYVTIHGYGAALEGALLKLPPTGGFPTLDYYIYNDGLQNGWEAWGGWGHVSQDYNNDENPANGDLAIKTVFNDAYGAMQIHNSGAANVFNGYNYLVFYVYVQGEESDIIAQIDNNGDFYPAHFVGDKWHQIVVPLADLAGSDNVSELRIKNNNGDAATNNTTVFIDEIGLTVDEPLGLLPDIITFIYNDAVSSPFGGGGGWGGSTTDFTNQENPRGGEAAIKATYAGGWGGAAQFGAWGNSPLSTAGMTHLAFSIYGADITDGANIQVNLIPTEGGTSASKQVSMKANGWVDVEIPLSDFNNPASIFELQFQDTDWAGTVFIDHIGLK